MIAKIIKALLQNSWLGFLAGLIFGVLIQYTLILVLAILVLVLGAGFVVAKEMKSVRNSRRRAKQFLELRDPDNEARLFAEKHGHHGVIVGKVIEVWAHHSLESMLPTTDLGVDPRMVLFSEPQPKDFSHALRRCGGLRPFGPPNQKKYGIDRLPLGTIDDENYVVEFFETDWNTYMSVRTRIANNPDLRFELSHIVPERSLVPQSMSLHFIVRFANGSILAMKRKELLAGEEGLWALSGEEQLHEDDFQQPEIGVAEFLFRRAFIEEVFGKRGAEAVRLNRIWTEDCTRIVHSYRIWGFFLEECSGIFQTFGVFHLKIGPHELCEFHKAAVSASWGSPDAEGYWYMVPKDGLATFLTNGSCEAYRLHGDSERRIINKAGLHATSRYRLWRLYSALNRSPETMTALGLRSTANTGVQQPTGASVADDWHRAALMRSPRLTPNI